MIWISCHVVGPMQTSAREMNARNLPPYTHNDYETRVPEIDPPRRVTVGSKTQNRCPRIRTGPDHTTLATRLQTERFSAKKQPQAPAPQKTAYRAHPARATRTFVCRGTLGGSPVTARRAGAAMTPAQLTPNPLPDEDDAETPQAPPASDAEDAPTPKKEDAAPAKTIRRAKRA